MKYELITKFHDYVQRTETYIFSNKQGVRLELRFREIDQLCSEGKRKKVLESAVRIIPSHLKLVKEGA